MADCRKCGAPLSFPSRAPVVCPFCSVVNDPPPQVVEVPVPVQIVHQTVNVVAPDRQSVPVELLCPGCRKRLVGVRAGEVELQGCGQCGGIWVDNDSGRLLLASPQRVFIELATNAGRNAAARRLLPHGACCPACSARFDHVRSYGVELDVCSHHGTWFDAFELRTLTEALLAGRAAETVNRSQGQTTCCRCSAILELSRVNVSDRGPMCDGCWGERQTEISREADSRRSAAGAQLLLGVAGGLLAAGLGSHRR